MITKTIQIDNISVDELTDKIAVNLLSKAVNLLSKIEVYLNDYAVKKNEALMTRTETADYLRINLSTLHYWTKNGYLNQYGIGNRRYYKKEDILNCLIKRKIKIIQTV